MTFAQRIEDSALSDLVFKALAHEFRRKLVFFLADAPGMDDAEILRKKLDQWLNHAN